MTDITTIERELREGLEGVTKGPWSVYSAPLRPGMSTIIEVQAEKSPEPVIQWAGFDNSAVPKKRHLANARHIARCDPDTIRALLNELARRAEVIEWARGIIKSAEGIVPLATRDWHGAARSFLAKEADQP